MHNPKLSLTTTILAFAISYGTYIISSFILLFAFLPFWHFILFKIPIFMPILAGILQLLLSFFLFRQKRFKKGMPFLSSTKFINFGTFLCLFFLVLLTYIQTANTSHLWTDAFFFLFFSLSPLPPSSSGGRHSLPSPTSTSCSFWSWNLCARNWRKLQKKWNI